MGRTKTVLKIKTRYYWPNQYVDIVKQVVNMMAVAFCETSMTLYHFFRSRIVIVVKRCSHS